MDANIDRVLRGPWDFSMVFKGDGKSWLCMPRICVINECPRMVTPMYVGILFDRLNGNVKKVYLPSFYFVHEFNTCVE